MPNSYSSLVMQQMQWYECMKNYSNLLKMQDLISFDFMNNYVILERTIIS